MTPETSQLMMWLNSNLKQYTFRSEHCCIARLVTVAFILMNSMTSWCKSFVTTFASQTTRMPIQSHWSLLLRLRYRNMKYQYSELFPWTNNEHFKYPLVRIDLFMSEKLRRPNYLTRQWGKKHNRSQGFQYQGLW